MFLLVVNKSEQRERSGHALPYWTAIPLLCARTPEIQLGIASLEDLTEESLGSKMCQVHVSSDICP